MPLEEEISPFNAFVWKHHFLAATVLVYYEWLITLDQEVERIWLAQWNMFTLLWLNVRYLPLFAMIVIASSVFEHWPTVMSFSCKRFAVVPTIFLLSGLVVAHIVFLLRTYALYARDRRVLYLLVPIIVAEVGTALWGASTEKHIISNFEGGCFPDSPQRVQGIVMWTVPFLFDLCVCVLTFAKSVKYYKDHEVQLMTLVLRDGLMYFGFIFLCYLANITLYLVFPGDIHDINAPMSGMITMVVTARLILNLRGVVNNKPPSPTYGRFTLTGMESVLAAFDGPLDTDERRREAKRTRRAREAAAPSVLERLHIPEPTFEYELAPSDTPTASHHRTEPPVHEEYEMHPIRPPALDIEAPSNV